MKLDWEDLNLFLAVARARGLAGATAETGKSAPTLGRRMLALEATTGSELFDRLPRGYELTEAGTALFNQLLEIESQIDRIEAATTISDRPLVKVSAGTWMTCLICREIKKLLDKEDAVRLRFIAADEELNISRREAVIGIRNQRPLQSGLAGRKLGRVQFAGYARSQSEQPWIKVVGNTPSAIWLSNQAESHQVLEVTSATNALDLALSGAGRVLLPTVLGAYLPGLKQVTSTVKELAHDQWLVTHQDERHKPLVRQTIDRLYDLLIARHKAS